jgi:ankyrin repeat protein
LARRVKDSSLTIGLDNEMALLKKLGTLTVENPAMNESLLAAFKERNLVTMSTALLAGANPNLAALKHWEQSNQHAKTVFLQAARNGDNEALSLLLQAGANPNLPDDFGRTALMQLNGPDFASCTSTLLYAGANLEVQDRYGQTPLLYQAKAANPLGVKNFLVQGANVNHLSREHDSALSLVFNRQELDSAAMECTQRLLDAGIQVRQADAKGAVFQKALYLLAADPSSQWVDRFLAAGADPNGKVPIGLSFLTAAIYWCKPAAEKLIKAGATPNFFSEKDDPFTAAIKEEQPEILKALLTAKPDYIAFLNQEKAEGLGIMNRNNSYRYIQHGEVLSHLARQKPTPEALACLKLLLESGLNPNLLDKDGQTALQVAKRLKNEPALTILEAAGGKSRHSGLERFNLKRLFARRTRVMPTPQKPKADPAKAALTGPPAEAPRPADTPTGERKQDA